MSENRIELRSEEVQEIVGTAPNWIVRWGIVTVFAIVVVVLVGSYLFRYPDIIEADVQVTTDFPPAWIQAKTSGKIDSIFVEDGSFVRQGSIIAYVENPMILEDFLRIEQTFKLPAENLLHTQFAAITTLGELQSSFSAYEQAKFNLKQFTGLDYHTRKITSLEKQLLLQRKDVEQKQQQISLLKKDLKVSRKSWQRDSTLHRQGVISQNDLEKAEQTFNQKKLGVESSKSALTTTELSVLGIEQQMLDLQLEQQKEHAELKQAYQTAYDQMQNEIKNWKQRYLLVAPISGRVTFTSVWKENQNITLGDKVFTIVPSATGRLLGKVKLAHAGAGKVRHGQRANVKFQNYPYMEYGMVRAEVKTISLVPNEDNYTVELHFPDSLMTNYGKQLNFTQQMKGTAEIVTENERLLMRFLAPLRSILLYND